MPLSKTSLISLFLVLSFAIVDAQKLVDLKKYRWSPVETTGQVKGRHENTFVEYKDKFYLLGGRGVNPVNVFDPATSTWETKGKSPFEIHHFQAVVYNDAIIILGAQTGRYPKEDPLTHIWKYYPENDTWEQGAEIPEDRRRGSGGVVQYGRKLYWSCGITLGHFSGTNSKFDSYDLETGEWEVLENAPHVRDHFSAIVVKDKMYCLGGRNSSIHEEGNFTKFFEITIPEVDVYDFKKEEWSTLPEPLPYPSAAGGIVNIGNYLVYFGGEGSYKHAYTQTQCLNLKTKQFNQLSTMYTGRHGSAAILYNDEVWFAAGSNVRGGANLSTMDKFTPNHSWEALFNGKDLEGWEVKTTESDKDRKVWYVEDGCIVSNSLDKPVEQYVWLMNERELSDFTLRIKFQATRENKGNSGVQIRSRYDEASTEDGVEGWLDGPQIDIDTKAPWRTGHIYDETRETKRWIYPSLPSWGIKKEDIKKVRTIFYFEDEGPGWNELLIVCEGSQMQTYLNNIQIANYDGAGTLDDAVHQKYNVGMNGKVALQLHKKAANHLRFKDIEVLEMF